MNVEYFHVHRSRPLGSGGEACVFQLTSAASGRVYAGKFPNALLPLVAQNQLLSELSRVMRVTGRYVVRPHAWNLGAQPFIVYEFAPFGSLRDEMNWIRGQGKVYHPAFALSRVRQMLLGIRDAHHSGVVHRDVKPDNFLVFASDDIRLHDFGVGRAFCRWDDLYSTRCVGTPNYAAPEQWQGCRVDGRADLYPVGVVLYEMLTGWLVDPAGQSPLPSRIYSNVLPSLDRFCCRLLAPDYRFRPANVDQALEEVQHIEREYLLYRQRFHWFGMTSPY